MAWRDNIHSHLVAWMKIMLPLMALGILSTLFLFSENFDPAESLPIATIDLQQRAQDQGATNATFAGVTRSGEEVFVQTQRARPSAEDPMLVQAEGVTAEYRLSSGAEVDITSQHAEMNQRINSASLSGDVRVHTSTGYRIKTDHLNTRFDDLFAESPGPVSGTAPAGDLTAGRMVLQHQEETGVSQLLFTDGVKLVYQPKLIEE